MKSIIIINKRFLENLDKESHKTSFKLFRVELSSTKTLLSSLVSEHDMDIKKLLHNLREEVTCSICFDTFTDPKHLPCLHSFCLQCLKQWQTTSHGRDTIRCPECQVVSKVPERGDLKDLPSSFYLSSLVDVLAIKEYRSSSVRCGYCEIKDIKDSEASYCFQCRVFVCHECVTGHNIIRKNKDHRVLALKDFQDKDYEDVLKRPAFCYCQWHTGKELLFFCKACETAICIYCAALQHDGHSKSLLEEEAETVKIQMKSMVKTQRNNLIAKMNATRQLDKLIQQGEDVKQEAVQSETTKKSIKRLTKRRTQNEEQIRVLQSALERAEKVLTLGTDAEIVHVKRELTRTLGVDLEGLVRLTLEENRKPFQVRSVLSFVFSIV